MRVEYIIGAAKPTVMVVAAFATDAATDIFDKLKNENTIILAMLVIAVWKLLDVLADMLPMRRKAAPENVAAAVAEAVSVALGAMCTQVDDLHRWHDIDDPDHAGAKLWWSVGVAQEIRELRKAIERLNQHLDRLEEEA